MPQDEQQATKAAFTFDLEEVDDTTTTKIYAFVHNLGDKDLIVSARDRQGNAIMAKSQIQDENVVIVTKEGGSWAHGDRILLLG